MYITCFTYIYTLYVTCNVPCAVVGIRDRWHCFLVATKLFGLCQSGGFLWCCKWFSAHQKSSRGPVVNLMILNKKWTNEDQGFGFGCFSPFFSKLSWGFPFSSLFITICILYPSFCLRQSQLQQEMRLSSWINRWRQLKYVSSSSLPEEMIQFDEHIFQIGGNDQPVIHGQNKLPWITLR